MFCLFVCFGIHNHATWCFLAHFDASILTSSVQMCVLYFVLCVTDQVFKCVFCVVCYISVQCNLVLARFDASIFHRQCGIPKEGGQANADAGARKTSNVMNVSNSHETG